MEKSRSPMPRAPLPEPSDSSCTVELFGIPADGVRRVWHLAAPLIDRAADRTAKLEISDVPKMLADGSCQLWVLYDSGEIGEDGRPGAVVGAVLTELASYYSGWKVGRVIALGGDDVYRWVHLIEGIEEWARGEGCDALEVIGRKGWERVLPEYKPIEHVFSKPLLSGLDS